MDVDAGDSTKAERDGEAGRVGAGFDLESEVMMGGDGFRAFGVVVVADVVWVVTVVAVIVVVVFVVVVVVVAAVDAADLVDFDDMGVFSTGAFEGHLLRLRVAVTSFFALSVPSTFTSSSTANGFLILLGCTSRTLTS